MNSRRPPAGRPPGPAPPGPAPRGRSVPARPAPLGAAAAVAAAAGLLVAGCGSVAASKPQSAPPPAPLPQLAITITAATGTSWAIVVMGGSSAQHNNFWELLTRPACVIGWHVVTPAGVADNGGLVAAGTGASSLVAAFRPSQDLSAAAGGDGQRRRQLVIGHSSLIPASPTSPMRSRPARAASSSR